MMIAVALWLLQYNDIVTEVIWSPLLWESDDSFCSRPINNITFFDRSMSSKVDRHCHHHCCQACGPHLGGSSLVTCKQWDGRNAHLPVIGGIPFEAAHGQNMTAWISTAFYLSKVVDPSENLIFGVARCHGHQPNAWWLPFISRIARPSHFIWFGVWQSKPFVEVCSTVINNTASVNHHLPQSEPKTSDDGYPSKDFIG